MPPASYLSTKLGKSIHGAWSRRAPRDLRDLDAAPPQALAMTLVMLLDLNTAPETYVAKSALGELQDQVAATLLHSGGGSHVGNVNSNLRGGSGAGNTLVQDESGGLTIPTAETTFVEVDIEDGVEFISTPQEPLLGMTFAIPDVVGNYYNSMPIMLVSPSELTHPENQREPRTRQSTYMCAG